ncbi:MAG: acyl-CoA synthetase [Sphingomonadales bacterium]|nr:MAG: acyl-CoA synthetase [Sphingomonadales bacterium]
MNEPTQPHLALYAAQAPDRPAVIMTDDGTILTYAELDARSDALARQLAASGVRAEDHVAILMENRPDFMVAAWAAQRAGLYYTPVNWHLTADEASYIVQDCGARVVLSSNACSEMLDAVATANPDVSIWLCDRGGASGFAPEGEAPQGVAYQSLEGSSMIYSSGTSGRPKGIKRRISGAPFGQLGAGDQMLRGLYAWDSDSVFLNPSPLYHAGPLNFAMSTHRSGGTVVLMRDFDPVEALAAIQDHRINKAWLVPTMMIRMLKVPDRERFDVGSMTHAVHTAAPCPRDTKRAMIDWWGPVLYEFYAATEGNGLTAITPQEWLEHPGSVGRSPDVRIVGEAGEVLPTGEVGVIYFASDWTVFEYHNDPEKTAEAHDSHGWTTIGDMGYLDQDGYLYLTDRKTNMIIAGGVNIYPQEAENVLAVHPAVLDVAVIGVPHPEYGEEVKAVVQLDQGQVESDALAAELVAHCLGQLAKYKCPRSVDFVEALPRMPNGKLIKRALRARYWNDEKVVI